MRKTTKTFLFFILLLAFALPIYAVPTPFETATFDDGLVIEFPLIDAVAVGQDTDFHFHVFNQSNGVPINSGLSCYFHLYNQTNKHLVELQENNPSGIQFLDYEFEIDGGNFSSVGQYAYVVQCNDSVKGGFDAVALTVSTSSRDITEARGLVLLSLMLGSILALLGCAFLFAYLYSNSDQLNKLLRLLYLGASMLCGIAAVSVVEILASDHQDAINTTVAGTLGGVYSLVLWVFRIVMSMLLIYLVYSSAMALLGKREDTYYKNGER